MNSAQIVKYKRENSQNPDNKTRSFFSFFQTLAEVSSISDVVEKVFNLLLDIYNCENCSFYFTNKIGDRVTAYNRNSEKLETIAILDEKLISRIYSITKPALRKRSISLRKNIPTIFCPYVLRSSLEFMIEIPLIQASFDAQQIIDEVLEILPVIHISLKNANHQKKRNLESKESTKILQSIASGIASIDSKGVFLFANQMFEMMIGYSLQELQESSTLINNIFPDFTFIILEGNVMDGLIYQIRRKDGIEFPCHVTITQVTEGDRINFIITLNDASYHLKKEAEIKNLRKSIANEDNIGVALFRFASFGGELVREDLRSIPIAPEYFSTMCYTSIAQGNKQPVGVFGPIPAPKLDNYITIIYAFFGKDDIPLDHRMKGRQYYLIAVVLPDRKIEFLLPNKKIERGFDDLVSKFEFPNRMNKEELSQFREIVFVE
ncbi:MAG: PAS domain S-box protein [Candidatus Heimdallarchaeota archaeon]|nr:PAS domain S-box protein [Candidatus Heimdallarchaeota archaeon]MCK4877900.1 PAS domain S-box protein [Candidatus Heimdallarchaeota archaeon]